MTGEVESGEEGRKDDWCPTGFLLTAHGLQEREKMIEEINWGPSGGPCFASMMTRVWPAPQDISQISFFHCILGLSVDSSI